MSPRRRQPDTILGGSITRAPNGYRRIPQYTPAYPTPMTVQQIYSNAKQRRYPPKWDGKEPEAKLIISLTDPIRISCGKCGAGLGRYVAYWARAEYGILQDVARHYHPRENFPPDQFGNSPQDRLSPANPRFWLTGEVGFHASKTFAHLRCPNCEHPYERNLRRFGKLLFESRPPKYALDP